MLNSHRIVSFVSALALSLTLAACAPESASAPSPNEQKSEARRVDAQNADGDTVVTLLFTNDIESVYDPIEAFWLDDVDYIGGLPQMTTLIEQLRESQPNVFLFDAGDIFTGSLAKLTNGQLPFELMISMGYDAMAIGNHEFEFGESVIAWEKNRAPFPVLGANMFYAGTDHPFAQAHAIVERDGVRIGVIGIMGQDAATAIIPSYIDELDVLEAAEPVRRSVEELRDEVDLIVLLTHQGKTAPMQTDAESEPLLHRDIDADIALAGAVEGIDVLFGGHADAGTPEPVIQPETGTLIMQTYGQGTHLGFLQLVIDKKTNEIKSHDGKLIPVESSKLTPDPVVAGKIKDYRAKYPELFEVVGETESILFRRYVEESSIGNLFADIIRNAAGSDIALFHSGGIRKDLPAGEVRRVDILDAYPFVDSVMKVQLSGAQLRAAIVQSLTFERGILQVSGLSVSYDLSKDPDQRLVSLRLADGSEIADSDVFTVAAPGFLAEGGDYYDSMPQGKVVGEFGKVGEVLMAYFQNAEGPIPLPAGGRQTKVE